MQASYKPVLIAYGNFFKRGFVHPKFKKKNSASQSVKINNINNRIRVENGKLYWRPFGWINLKGYGPEITGKIKYIILKKQNTNGSLSSNMTLSYQNRSLKPEKKWE